CRDRRLREWLERSIRVRRPPHHCREPDDSAALIDPVGPASSDAKPRHRPTDREPLARHQLRMGRIAGGELPRVEHRGPRAACLLFGFLRRTFARSRLPGNAADADGLALLCALAWVVHPLNTESVSYITQRTESMMGLFYVGALYAAARALESSSHRLRWELL